MYRNNLSEKEKKLQWLLAYNYDAEDVENDVWYITISDKDMDNLNIEDLESGKIICKKEGTAIIGNEYVDIADFYLDTDFIPENEMILCVYDFTNNKNLGL